MLELPARAARPGDAVTRASRSAGPRTSLVTVSSSPRPKHPSGSVSAAVGARYSSRSAAAGATRCRDRRGGGSVRADRAILLLAVGVAGERRRPLAADGSYAQPAARRGLRALRRFARRSSRTSSAVHSAASRPRSSASATRTSAWLPIRRPRASSTTPCSRRWYPTAARRRGSSAGRCSRSPSSATGRFQARSRPTWSNVLHPGRRQRPGHAVRL